MVAAVYTNVSTVTHVKLLLNDTATDDDKSFLTPAQYRDFIMKHIAAEEQDWIFRLVTANYYRYTPAGSLFLFNPFGSSDTTESIFTGEDDCEYTINPTGFIEVTTGTHSEDTITVTAARVDLAELMVDFCMFIAQHRAQEVSQAMGEGSYTPEEVYQKLISMAEIYRGVVALGP